MIKTIVIPTPKRIKKNIKSFTKKYINKERVIIYTLIGSGLVMISTIHTTSKHMIYGSLIYNLVAFEVLEKWYSDIEKDEEFKKLILEYDIFTKTTMML